MKNFLKKIVRGVKRSGAALLAAGVCLCAIHQAAGASVPIPPQTGYFTNGALPYPLMITNGQTITFNSTNDVKLFRDRGMAFTFLAAGTNASAITNLVLTFDVTVDDSTNYTTTGPIVWSQVLGGNTYTRGWTNVLRDRLDNCRKVRLSSIYLPIIGTGNTNTIWITNTGWASFP